MALTIEQIARLKNMPGRHSDGHGLCLQVINRNNASWLFRYERGGRERWMGLGPLHTITLKEARELARDARKLLLAGKDPLDMRRQERAAIDLAAARTTTFANAARQYHEHHADKWDNAKHKAQFLSSLEQHIFPVIGSLPVADIDTPAVLRALEPIWKKIPETASRLRGRIERVLSFATIRGYRQGENPARWRGHLGEMLATRKAGKVKHHRALPFAEMPTFMAALAEREGMSARAMEFLILTAARTGEVVSCRWSEIDLDAKLWTIPADRMKAGKAHRVPLSDRALAILRALPRESDFVFVGQRKGTSISDAALLQVLKRMERTDFVVHGLRSSFRDWCAEKTTYAHHIIESALAHAVGSKTERAYLRSDLLNQRVSLMQDWAGYLYAPPSRGGVVPIRDGGSDMANIADITLEWLISLAKDGDREPLAEWLSRDQSIDPMLREFLVGLVRGTVKLKRQRKLTFSRNPRNIPEQNVVFIVRAIMARMGKQRDESLRTRLTLEACEHFGTRPELVANYLRHRGDAKRRGKRQTFGR